jgi:hypothetical protein
MDACRIYTRLFLSLLSWEQEEAENGKRVVVTGLNMITPLGLDLKSRWDYLVAGKSGIIKITLFDAADYETQLQGNFRMILIPMRRDSAKDTAPDKWCEQRESATSVQKKLVPRVELTLTPSTGKGELSSWAQWMRVIR